jgi:hypothetical protein
MIFAEASNRIKASRGAAAMYSGFLAGIGTISIHFEECSQKDSTRNLHRSQLYQCNRPMMGIEGLELKVVNLKGGLDVIAHDTCGDFLFHLVHHVQPPLVGRLKQGISLAHGIVSKFLRGMTNQVSYMLVRFGHHPDALASSNSNATRHLVGSSYVLDAKFNFFCERANFGDMFLKWSPSISVR